jgi:1-acyl-sn-glycerol-3-phosphate acyltransferase
MNDHVEASEILSQPRAGVVRRLWGVIATVLSVLYTAILLIPCAIVAPFAHGHLVSPLMRLWSRMILLTCGIKIEIDGLENVDGLDSFVLVSNHQSLFDIVAICHRIPGEIRFVAKREIRQVPLLGYVLARSENIVIDRQSGGKAIRRVIEVARHGYSICVFAEGHRYSDNHVHEFNDGAAWLAIATHLPCVPMAICGTAALMPRGSKFVIPGRRMLMRLGKPIATAGLRSADRERLTRQQEDAVRALFVIEV